MPPGELASKRGLLLPTKEYLIASITIICLLLAADVGGSFGVELASEVDEAALGANQLRHPSRDDWTPSGNPMEASSFAWNPPRPHANNHPTSNPSSRPRLIPRAPPGGLPSSLQTKALQQSQQSTVLNLERPKLVQWSREVVQYSEGSTLVLTCSLASAQIQPIKFSWFRQGRPLVAAGSSTIRLSVDSQPDFSFVRLADLRATDSGSYTCIATNQLGQEDRTTAQVQVNVKLKWIQTIHDANSTPGSSGTDQFHTVETVRAGLPVNFECAATGQPRPRIRWFRLVSPSSGPSRASNPRLDDQLVKSVQLGLESVIDSLSRTELATRSEFNDSRWRVDTNMGGLSGSPNDVLSRLQLDRVDPFSQGIYECEASPDLGSQSNPNQERIRRQFGLLVNGKCDIPHYSQVDSWVDQLLSVSRWVCSELIALQVSGKCQKQTTNAQG